MMFKIVLVALTLTVCCNSAQRLECNCGPSTDRVCTSELQSLTTCEFNCKSAELALAGVSLQKLHDGPCDDFETGVFDYSKPVNPIVWARTVSPTD